MKIAKLILKNWKSHESTTLDLGPMTLIRGANNSGKSAIAEAIEFVLTGRSFSTGEAGQGGEALVRVGAKEASIEAVIGDNAELTIARTRNGAGSQATAKTASGRSYAGRQIEEQFARRGWSKDILSAVLRLNRFGWLEPGEQKEFLADILRPDDQPVPNEILDIMRALADEIHPTWSSYVGAGRIDLAGARAVEKDALEARASCSHTLKEIGKPEPPATERPKDAPTEQQIRSKLDKLRVEHSRVLVEKTRLETEWAQKSEKARKLPDLILVEKQKILTVPEEAKCMKEIESESQIQQAEEELAGIRALLAEYKRQLGEIPKVSGKCPTCGAETDCNALRTRIGESAKSVADRVPSLQLIASGRANIADAKLLLRNHREAIIEVDRLKEELAGLNGLALPDVKPLAAKLEELDARIKKGQEVLAEAAAWAQKADAYADAVKQRERLEAGREAADTLARWMGPSGFQSQMAAGKLGPFLEAVNATLETFGYHCTLEMEPYSIRVCRLGAKQSLELDSLSESEKWRFSLGFQAAVAKVTGLKLIVCDCADVLIGPNRSALLKAVVDAGLDQVILLASAVAGSPVPPQFTVFDLELVDGRTKVKKGG